jgi:hypothetical protein
MLMALPNPILPRHVLHYQIHQRRNTVAMGPRVLVRVAEAAMALVVQKGVKAVRHITTGSTSLLREGLQLFNPPGVARRLMSLKNRCKKQKHPKALHLLMAALIWSRVKIAALL